MFADSFQDFLDQFIVCEINIRKISLFKLVEKNETSKHAFARIIRVEIYINTNYILFLPCYY